MQQYTQYAYYVKQQVAYKDHENDTLNVDQGQSNIRYFQTEPDLPTAPIVETVSKTDTGIFIQWYPAVLDKELIEYYKVDVFVQPDDHKVLDSRDYCLNPREDKQISVGVEVPSEPKERNCTFAPVPDNWESSSDWEIDQRIECYRQRDEDIDRRTELSKFLNPQKKYMCEWNDENCPYEYVENENERFTRTVHNVVKKYDIDFEDLFDIFFEPISIEEDIIPEIRENPNFLFTKRFDQAAYNTTIDDLKPFTLYTLHFFSCNRIGCSSYYMHNERTEAAISADDMDFQVLLDPTVSHTVHLDFDEPETPNGLTVAFEINIHDETNMSYTKKCITRKEHYDNNRRFTLTNLQKGKYGFTVNSISLAMDGALSAYKSIIVYNTLAAQTIIIIAFVSIALAGACVAATVYLWRRIRERRRIASLTGSRQNILMCEETQSSRFNVSKMEDDLFDIAEDDF